MKLAALLLAVALGAANAASAQMISAKPAYDPAPPAKPTVAANGKVADGDRVICREDEITGNRIKSRICHTKHEWDVMEGNARDAVQAIQEKNNTLCPGGSC